MSAAYNLAYNGGDAFKAALADTTTGLREAVEDKVAETALAIEAEVKTRIQRSPATGRVYQKYNPRRTHRASAPGEAPASDTGNLVNSIYTDIEGLSATVGSLLAYASYLEYGTLNMSARPLWTPVAEEYGRTFRSDMEATVARVVK